ncbi:MAG TPA: antibiotic biosynthesis monooxygenase [Gammaproteobacteria bacterium]|nr:antibiotic biosynthesis monooxygenase [Gammaproteobacteria bacterium]
MSIRTFALGAVVAAFGLPQTAAAQPSDALYVVTYLEALPADAGRARDLLAAYAEESRRADGNREFEALERIGRPNHFAILEAWTGDAARSAHERSPAAERFRQSLTPLLYSPPDRREQHALLTAPIQRPGGDAVYVLTHVDVVPPSLDQAVEHLRELAEASRSEAGNLRFDVLVTERKNHMTLIEAWDGNAAHEVHLGAAHNRTFRMEMAPLLGALYDERLYRGL